MSPATKTQLHTCMQLHTLYLYVHLSILCLYMYTFSSKRFLPCWERERETTKVRSVLLAEICAQLASLNATVSNMQRWMRVCAHMTQSHTLYMQHTHTYVWYIIYMYMYDQTTTQIHVHCMYDTYIHVLMTVACTFYTYLQVLLHVHVHVHVHTTYMHIVITVSIRTYNATMHVQCTAT